MPENTEVTSEFGSCAVVYELQSQKLKIAYNAELKRNRYPAGKYEELREFVQQVNGCIQRKVVLKKA